MKIKFLEWNLHAMGGNGYEIPIFISDYINKVDIFVLVEFCMEKGWDIFKKGLKEFDLYCSPYVSNGYNQVCIGIRKNINYELLAVVSKDVADINTPEFLQVDIGIEKKKVSIIGTRIKIQNTTQSQQFDHLKRHLKKIDSFLCLGDFNVANKKLSGIFSSVANVYGPRIVNGYQDAKDSPYATYDWSFLTSENGYETKTKDDYLGIKGIPDHAILKGMAEL